MPGLKNIGPSGQVPGLSKTELGPGFRQTLKPGRTLGGGGVEAVAARGTTAVIAFPTERKLGSSNKI